MDDFDRWRFIAENFRQIEALAAAIVNNSEYLPAEFRDIYGRMLANARDHRMIAERMSREHPRPPSPQGTPRPPSI